MESNQSQSESTASLVLEQLEDRLEMESMGTLISTSEAPVDTTPVCICHF